jgi:hypothetical protein
MARLDRAEPLANPARLEAGDVMRTLRLALATKITIALLCGLGTAALAQETDEEATTPAADIEAIADLIMQAWAPDYDEAKIEAIYHPDVVMMLDANVIAADREELKNVARNALRLGNTYTRVGPVIPYESADGDLYLASVIDVRGYAHQSGDPVIGFYRVRDGRVIRHIFMEASGY